jgi:AMIN domain-containing protein
VKSPTPRGCSDLSGRSLPLFVSSLAGKCTAILRAARRSAWPFAFLVALSPVLHAANPVSVQNLDVRRAPDGVRVEITLSEPVLPVVTTTNGPDRLVVELPGTISDAKQRRIPVNAQGVKSVRMGLNSAAPPVTRVVVDLDSMQQYSMETSGRKITLFIADMQAVARQRGAPPAASGGIGSIFSRRQGLPPAPKPPDESASDVSLPQTPPQTVAAQPTASRPNKGSLQEGTVFPGMTGTAAPAAAAPASSEIPEVAVVRQMKTPEAQGNASQAAPKATAPLTITAAGQAPFVVSVQGVPVPPAPVKPQVSTETNVAGASPATGANDPTAAKLPASSSTTTPPPAVHQQTTAAAPPDTTPILPDGRSASTGNSISVVREAVIKPPAQATVRAENTGGSSTNVAEPSKPAGVSEAVASAASEKAAPVAATVPAPVSVTSAEAKVPPPTNVPASSASNTAIPAQTAKSTAPEEANSTTAAASTQSTGPEVVLAPQPETESQPSGPVVVLAPQPEEKMPVQVVEAAPVPESRLAFQVKYVSKDAAYLEGGRSAGLTEGMKLEVRDDSLDGKPNPDGSDPRLIARLEVASVAETSSVTDIKQARRPIKPGDVAYLSSEDQATLTEQQSLSSTRKYPQVITFTEGDPLEEEQRAEVPRPPLPEINRARGRIGVDYSGIMGLNGSSPSSSQVGLVLRADITRIGGTYWNLSGYWRGRMTQRSSAGTQTLQDLLNRTYHLAMTYDNPNSRWVAGVGRLYLPWASSLETIDGGYFGRRIGAHSTMGIFGGSTPDPTSWNYNPDRRMGGAFVNFEGGSYDSVRFTSTIGSGISTLNGQFDRPFVFVENGIYYKRFLSIYESAQADNPPGSPAVARPGPGLARSFVTVRVQPHERISFDFNHNYFRDVPTFDPSLIGTGLLDKYLFQGFSAGVRVEPIRHIFLYTNMGLSSRTGDTRSSLNQMYGFTVGQIWRTGLRGDVRYSRFNSSFGDGEYEAASLSRNISDAFRVEVQYGQQKFISGLSANSTSRFVNTMLDTNLGKHYFFTGGFTVDRGVLLDYNQWFLTLGYRCDNRGSQKK